MFSIKLSNVYCSRLEKVKLHGVAEAGGTQNICFVMKVAEIIIAFSKARFTISRTN